jgi:hypothetical protein
MDQALKNHLLELIEQAANMLGASAIAEVRSVIAHAGVNQPHPHSDKLVAIATLHLAANKLIGDSSELGELIRHQLDRMVVSVTDGVSAVRLDDA